MKLHVLEPNPDEVVIAMPDLEQLSQSDPIVNMFFKVQNRATQDPLWNKDYVRATYNAFYEEYRLYLLDKFTKSK